MKNGRHKRKSNSEINSSIAAEVKLFTMCHGLKESSLRLNVLEDLTSGETQCLLHDLSVMLDRISDEIEKE